MKETSGNKKYERRQKCRNKEWDGRKIEEGGKRLLVPVLEFR